MVIYADELERLGLPIEGLTLNGPCLSNEAERVEYIRQLDDLALNRFINLLVTNAREEGYAEGQADAHDYELSLDV